MTDSPAFLLSKWYLDCVAEDGTAFIGYVARLRWRVLPLDYASILIRRPDGTEYTQMSLARESFQLEGSRIRWVSRHFRMEAEWTRVQRPIERELFNNDTGGIRWSCMIPLGKATITIRDRATVRGFGYVERMDLSIPPWHLPKAELRWGRFLTDTDAVVWIDWKGNRPLTLLLHNGNDVVGPVVTDDDISGGNGFQLSFAQHTILRKGPIISTTLSAIPGLAMVLPEQILRMNETKWLSSGRLAHTGSPSRTGRAIHEVVAFS